MCRPALGPT